MKRLQHNIKAAIILVAAFVLFSAVDVYGASRETKSLDNMKNQMDGPGFLNGSPDFAFPEMVIDYAESILQGSPSDAELVRAVVELVLARNIKSYDSATSTAAMIDSIAAARGGAVGAVLYSVEAQLVKDVFQGSYKAYSRELPLDQQFPEDMNEWSADMFRVRILELCRKSLADTEVLKATPISSWDNALDGLSDEQQQLCPDLYTFLAWRAYTLTDVGSRGSKPIPFFGSESEYLTPSQKSYAFSQEVLKQLLDYARQTKSPLLLGKLLEKYPFDSEDEHLDTILSACKEYEDTPLCYVLLDDLTGCVNRKSDDEKDSTYCSLRDEVRTLLSNYISRFHDSPNVNSVRNNLASLSRDLVTATAKNVYRGDEDVMMTVKGDNIDKALYVKVFRFEKDDDSLTDFKMIMNPRYTSFVDVREVEFIEGDDCRGSVDSLNFGKLPYGSYAAVFASKGGVNRDGISNEYSILTFDVTDLASISLHNQYDENSAGLYVVDNLNGAPLENVEVKFTGSSSSKYRHLEKTMSISVRTDTSGFASFPKKLKSSGYGDIEVKKGKDVLKDDYSFYFSNRISGKDKRANLYTDLAIYHPGDTVRFMTVVYDPDKNNPQAIPDAKVKVVLRNAASETVDTLSVRTDRFGKAIGSFALPKKGINGSYELKVYGEDIDELGRTYVEVADYVAPKFFVEVSTSSRSYKLGDTVKVEGVVKTYSGMPVGGASVKIKVDFNEDYYFWRFRGRESGSFSATVTSDSDGRFSLDLPTNLLTDAYKRGFFIVTAEATTPAGETQSSESASFSLGAESSISEMTEGLYNVGSSSDVTLVASVKDLAGLPVKTELDYKLKNKKTDEIVASGKFESPELLIPSSKVASGEYLWIVSDASGQEKSSEIIVVRPTDAAPPKEAALWIPYKTFNAGEDENQRIVVGSSFADQYILYVLSEEDRVIESRWLKADKENLHIELPKPPVGKIYFVDFFAVRDGQSYSEKVLIASKKYAEQLTSEVVTFRDKISAGGKEMWSFRYLLGENQAGVIPVAATMTDKALNSLRSLRWDKLWLPAFHDRVDLSGPHSGQERMSWWFSEGSWNIKDRLTFPTLNTFKYYSLMGYPSADRYYTLGGAAYSAAPSSSISESVSESAPRTQAKNAKMSRSRSKSMKMENAEVETSADTSGTNEADTGAEKYRASECPIAFFMPSLVTDQSGVVDIAFVAPDFNTTWQLSLMAYDPTNLKNVVSTFDAVASKKVMVQSQLPRFLRTDDKAVFAFTAFNNSGEEAEIKVKASIYNPITDEIIAERIFDPRTTAADASFVETMEFVAPDNLSLVGVRVYATLGGSSDGEQSVIGILPSSTPVTESEPFYLAPDETKYTMNYPSSGKGSTAVFSYCDNPVWYCLTALPDMTFPEDATIFSTLRHLYGKAIAAGLVSRYPRLKEALALWSETDDSTLVSPLQRDENLKIIALDETPWTLNAEGETLRMSRLIQLLDSTECEKSIRNALDELCRKQRNDGGWSWCEGMSSSTFITSRVLLYLSMLRQMNFLPESQKLSATIERAVNYTDKILYRDYLNNKKRFSTTLMLNYLYVRSGLDDIPMSREFTLLQDEAIAAIKKEWRKFGIYDAAVAAIVLNRWGYPMEARSILESLNQRATKSKERGMWFDNLGSSWGGYNKLITTAQVLEAFSEVNPQAPQIDGLRQWLVIQRETEDWGTMHENAEVVYAILSSGSDWTADFDALRILINGVEQTISKRDALTGSFVLPLDVAGATVEVIKSPGHQAWGGILSRRIEPIVKVKPFSKSDIAITKRVLRVIEDANGVHTEELRAGMTLKKGDKVRVEIKLTSKRDMDYVCVIDGRSACLSPVEQLSGYLYQDGAGYYRDVRNDCTNLFFSFLPKGVTYTGYDCYVSQDGVYSLGIAQTQCLYAPLQTAHSGGSILSVGD